MPERVYLSAPDVGELEESFVMDALRSGWVAPLGPHVDRFEAEMAERVGVQHAIALSSGTAALHLALLEMGARPGTFVVVPTLTFAATANAVAYTGASPVFVDCDLGTGNLDAELLGQCLQQLRAENAEVVAVISVDLFGRAANYDAIVPVCQEAGVQLLEDAAEALGATYGGTAAGAFGHAGVLSFNGNKIMTTSGGGMLLTADDVLAARVRHLSTQAREPVPHYEHTEIGYNYRLSNILAALGRAQLSRLDEMIERRRSLRELYRKLFAVASGVDLLGGHDDEHDNCWLTVVTVDQTLAGWTAGDLAAHLATRDIETRPVWKPMHQQPVFAGARSFLNGSADLLFAHGIALPSGSSLTQPQRDLVLDGVNTFLEGVR